MAVIYDSETASQLRDRLVKHLTERYDDARAQASIPHWVTKVERSRREGYANALFVEMEFWRSVWIDGKQWAPRVRRFDTQGRKAE